MRRIFERKLQIPASAAQVFAWHERPDALQKLIPPGDPVRVLEHKGGIEDGARVVLRVGPFPFSIKWVAVHKDYVVGRQFRDVQVKGPFAFWEHTHTVVPDGDNACTLIDHVEYDLPLGLLGRIADPLIRRKLNAMFDWRHRVTYAENAG